jgi:thioesterase domain-containing protein
VAFEMACQLRAQGQEVALLALINSFPPNSPFGNMAWSPVQTLRFFRNLLVLAGGFLRGEMGNRTDFVLWKLRRLMRPLVPRGRGEPADPEQFADVRAFPKGRLQLLTVHSRALERYRNRSYPSAVTLLRTRSFPLFCSFDPHYGWGEFAQGGVVARVIPGSHDNIMKEPNIRELARELAAVAELSGR